MYKKINLASFSTQYPPASAHIKGSSAYPDIDGQAEFYQTRSGVIAVAEITGLPTSNEYGSRVFGFHIHEGGSCSGNSEDPFFDVLGHYNPKAYPHPYHAGDMPPLFSNNGFAFSAFLTDRFTIDEIIGKTVIIHSMQDDFTTQPSGNAGIKIACGVIK